MSNQVRAAAHFPVQADEPVRARQLHPGKQDMRGSGLDPRRARMLREVESFGFEWRVVFEAGRLVAAMAVGALLTFWLAGHRPSNADTAMYRAGGSGGAASVARVPAASPEERGEPALLAPLAAPAAGALDTPQRDVHSDGGGH